MAMAMRKVPRTADELDDVPDDGQRYELIAGTLFVSPGPTRKHQRASRLLTRWLDRYAESLGLELMYAPLDVRAAADTQVEPDLFVLPHSFEGRDDHHWEPMSQVLLCVEILSPSTTQLDREIKRLLYQSQGVAEYWIVDLSKRSVDVWTPDAQSPRTVRDALVWNPDVAHEPLVIELPALFDAVHR
jgi:Uma2 family endonuclease